MDTRRRRSRQAVGLHLNIAQKSAGVVATLMLFATLSACSSASQQATGDRPPATTTTQPGSELAVQQGGGEAPAASARAFGDVAPVTVKFAPGAPGWCAEIVGDGVLALPNALDELYGGNEADAGAAIAAASATFASLSTEVPASVRLAGVEAATALNLLRAEPYDPEPLAMLEEAMFALERTSVQCGIE